VNILIVAAHPDDEVLGCGGTIAGLSESGNVRIGILGEGIRSRYPEHEVAPQAELIRLKEDAQAAGEILGVSQVVFGELPDNCFDDLPLLDIVKKVEKWVKEFQPEVIYTHHPGDLNIDHTITFRAVLTATRPVIPTPVREIFAFEIPSSTEWAFQSLTPNFRANSFVDITATIEQKIQAFKCFRSETRPSPHPRSPEVLRIIAQRWGSVIGVEYAEAFEVIRSVR